MATTTKNTAAVNGTRKRLPSVTPVEVRTVPTGEPSETPIDGRVKLIAWLSRLMAEVNCVQGMIADGAFGEVLDENEAQELTHCLSRAWHDLAQGSPILTPPELDQM